MNDSHILKKIRGCHLRIFLLSKFAVLTLIAPWIGAIVVSVFDVNVNLHGKGIYILILPIICLVTGILLGSAATKQKKKLKLFVGEYVIRDIIAQRITVKEYNPVGCFNHKFLRQSKILPAFDNCYGSDYIKGVYKGHDFTYCDIMLEREYETTDDKGRREHRTSTVFQGAFMSLILGKPLGNKYVRILERKSKRRQPGFISDLFSAASNALGIKSNESRVSMENEAFNNQFEVKTNDEELAFYILTPQFMEAVVSIDGLVAGFTNISFNNDRVYISLNNENDAFELPKTIHNRKHLAKAREKFRNELNQVLSIIDEILKKDNLF